MLFRSARVGRLDEAFAALDEANLLRTESLSSAHEAVVAAAEAAVGLDHVGAVAERVQQDQLHGPPLAVVEGDAQVQAGGVHEDIGDAVREDVAAGSHRKGRLLDRPGVADLFEIENGVASLIDMKVPQNAKVVGKVIEEINIPTDCVVAALTRDKKFVVPRGKTEIQADDHVIFVGTNEAIQEVNVIFTEVQE